jgi:hypothetical protein
VGVTVLVVLAIPAVSADIRSKPYIAVSALAQIASGAGLLLFKRWAVYLYFTSWIAMALFSYIFYGQVNLGLAWIGALVVGVVSALYWKHLS